MNNGELYKYNDKHKYWYEVLFNASRFTHACMVVVAEETTDVVMVNMFSGVYVDITIDFVSDIDVEVLTDANTNLLVTTITNSWFAMSATWEGEPMSFCWPAFSCWALNGLDCDRVLQAWIPSCHVWWSFVLPKPPHFLNQEPPRPQQLILSDFPMVPHLGHTETAIVVVTAGVTLWHWSAHTGTNLLTVIV